MVYGDKRDYPKINLFVNGRYVASTTWAATCAQAARQYAESLPRTSGLKIEGRFDQSRKRKTVR